MCLLIVKQAGIPLTETTIENAINSARINPDSFGLSFISNETLEIKTIKTLSVKQFKKELYKLIGFDGPIIIHTRLATQGAINLANCHPFDDLIPGWVIAHNGILDGYYISHGGDESDTVQFIKQVLYPLKDCLHLPAIQKVIEDHISSFNKLALMSPSQPNIIILNEKQGHYDEQGVWYSNHSYIIKTVKDTGLNPWWQKADDDKDDIDCIEKSDKWENLLDEWEKFNRFDCSLSD